MGEVNNKILVRMLERLFAGLMTGPNLNCRPHSSRQRVDFIQVGRLKDLPPEEALRRILGEGRGVKLHARAIAPKHAKKNPSRKSAPLDAESEHVETHDRDEVPDAEVSPEEKAIQKAWSEQQTFLGKLRILADEARTYEQDTGVHVLNVGFPLLSLPPGSAAVAGKGALAKRVLAPAAFIPVAITLRPGPSAAVEIGCKSDGVDRVVANPALLAWLEQQTGTAAGNLFTDEEGEDPWREISELVRHVARVLGLTVPELFAEPQAAAGPVAAADGEVKPVVAQRPGEGLKLAAAPRADDEDAQPALVVAAVLGLFPMNNQGLLQDMQAMVAGESLSGPVESFVNVGVNLDQAAPVRYDHEAWCGQKRSRAVADERPVSVSDPCQARAVQLARECRGLVIHGPPGTGKSQTITNIIGDHLSRGRRVLVVCDKRTALDVVANRLEHLGLGQLCALVHDPRRDQRELYRAIREQLENLTEARSSVSAEKKLGRIDAELEKLHAELTACWSLLMEKDEAEGASFHELVGQWWALPGPEEPPTDMARLGRGGLVELETHESDVRDLLVRAAGVGFHQNGWARCAGLSLGDFLARPMAEVRAAVQECLAVGRETDATADPVIPPFLAPGKPAGPGKGKLAIPDLAAQGRARADLAERFHRVVQGVDVSTRTRWAGRDIATVSRMRQKLAEVAPHVKSLRSGPLDTELGLIAAAGLPNLALLTRQLNALDAYLAIASRWYSFLCWNRRSRAREVLGRFGLALNAADAERLRQFLTALRSRLVVQGIHQELSDLPGAINELAPDSVLDETVSRQALLLDLLNDVGMDPGLGGLEQPVRHALVMPDLAAVLEEGLRRSGRRADALTRLEGQLAASGLFDRAWVRQTVADLAGGMGVGQAFQPDSSHGEVRLESLTYLKELEERLDSLEGVLRIRHGMGQLPASLGAAVRGLLAGPVDVEEGLAALRKTFLAAEITYRLRSNAKLQGLDGQRLQSTFERYRSLEAEKRGVVRDMVLHLWTSRQKERLLVGTGSRLNSLGADLRRRLTMRGERAMRLRQVIAVGQGIEGGDPVFDLRPVWLASPETVAQIFPRLPLFEVVIFDEASQCRLEEALPVLTRAQRVVIAGDPQQLPPTRFFESAVAVSEDDEIETEQQLFEAHQGEIEDLLGAALSLDIQQCYLDVHYRSHNADLIQFSNQQFYCARLQPIPGHPKNRTRFAPITLYRADGIYEERQNPAEADRVCQIVRDLLRRAEPPSIGIACFNLAQRDLIVEKLDDLAEEDAEFGHRLAEARSRVGVGSFEGLFVKNLENVQGDERDHIIMSTTYGPDDRGRFYRRFGPLGRAGGGRRLNVLVTRARQEIHLVTSIPPAVYRSLPPVPNGQAPGGGWLLFAYLAYAEQLARAYEAAHHDQTEATPSLPAEVHVRPSRSPSSFAAALAHTLAGRHQVGSEVYWGNEGFCVDVALHHPRHAEDVTIGVLCDGVRFHQAEDPVEWDLFRTAILEGQGWLLHRVWTPHFFRDPAGGTRAILKEAAECLAAEEARDGIRVQNPSR
jgi:hypothetical protein